MPNMFVFPNTFFDFSYYFFEFILSIDDVVFMTKLPTMLAAIFWSQQKQDFSIYDEKFLTTRQISNLLRSL